MRETFDPFFNAVQGMKLAPLVGPEDMEALFAQEGVSSALLPSLAPALYSTHCSAPIATPFCDVISSFDDPNCDNCDASELTGAGSPQGWVPGRGLVAWNPYDPTGSTPRNVLTNFPLASTQEAYDSLYTRVFRVPDAVPGFVGFDDPNSPWEVTQGGATLTQNTDEKTEGSASLQIDGCNFVEISSPSFKTADFGVFSNQLSIDVYIPENADPDYVGDVALLISVRGAEMNHEWADQVELTPPHNNMNLGSVGVRHGFLNEYNSYEFSLPSEVVQTFQQSHSGCQLSVAFSMGNPGGAQFRMDNMGFIQP